MASSRGGLQTILLLSFFCFMSCAFRLTQAASFPRSFQSDEGPIRRELEARTISNGAWLRICPLGASITVGYLSSDGNGYREGLRSNLVLTGNPVNMVGEFSSGSMADNQVEAVVGDRIDQIATIAENSIPFQPNVWVIHAGTNDMTQNYYVSTAHERLGDLIDHLFDTVPDTVVVVSTLIPNADAQAEANIEIFNANLPGMVSSRADAGAKLLLVDMHTGFITVNDLQDGTHPTDEGYQKMAVVWESGFDTLASNGWVNPPNYVSGLNDTLGSSGSSDNTCQKVMGNADGPHQTQVGSGENDGNYVHTTVDQGKFVLPGGSGDQDDVAAGLFWADINGDGIDDYVWIKENGKMGVSLNSGGGKFGKYLEYSNGIYCNLPGIRFGDINADGLDDFFCVYPNGELHAWLNAPTTVGDARQPTWTSLGLVKDAVDGYTQADVRLGDIDGDGRIDYMVIAANGDITAWRNGGTLDYPAFWQGLGVVFTGKNEGDPNGVRFVDINGDGRDDWLFVTDEGQVTTYINQRGLDVGLVPAWLDAGITHTGDGIGVTNRTTVSFGKVWGSSMADYIFVYEPTSELSVAPTLEIWQNTGHGGTQLNGDGVYYCDMTGSGSDDYAWIDPNGIMTLYGNIHDPPNWQQWGVIFTPPGAGYTRKDIHLADFDGDKKCDYLIVDKDTGAVTMWKNEYDNGVFAFTNLGIVSAGASCTEGYGIGLFDLGVRFADIDGDGLADYLCIAKDGTVHGFLNRGLKNFVDYSQVKKPEGADRANVRFADINGDGRADYLWVDKFNGSVQAWTSNGIEDSGGSTFDWTPRGLVAAGGIARGACINFGNLKGIGRADYIEVYPTTCKAYTWFNVCPGGSSPPTTSPTHVQFEWIALGDSYASGVGAGNLLQWGRCLRYSMSYPQQLNNDEGSGNSLPAPRKFTNACCSGATAQQIMDNQFRDQDGYDSQYGARPAFGNPTFATLNLGGNDIGLANLLNSCVYGFVPIGNDCNTQVAASQAILSNPEFVTTMSTLMQEALTKGRAGTAGNGFQLYVLGYARFFNNNTDLCDDTNWQKGGKTVPNMTKALRTTFNDMADQLNVAIAAAVTRVANSDPANRIFFIDWQATNILEGHRYCEEGVQEPENNPNTYFYQYGTPLPDNADEALFQDLVAHYLDPSVTDTAELTAKYGNTIPAGPAGDDADDFWTALMLNANTTEPDDMPDWTPSLNWGTIGGIASVFHPTEHLHTLIKTLVFSRWAGNNPQS